MSTVKQAMADLIAQQPDDISYDEILRELAYARMIGRGLVDSDAGNVTSNIGDVGWHW